MKRLYLIDGTFELFRGYYAVPSKVNSAGQEVAAVQATLRSIKKLIRDEKVEYIACATDHVIESFRNQLFDGYKTSAGIPEDLYSQFPILEKALSAMGITLWAMKKFEADDALATATVKYTDFFEQIIICSPDKDMMQCVNKKVICIDRIRDKTYNRESVYEKFGVYPEQVADYLALVGDSADGIPGLPGFGAKSTAMLLDAFQHIEQVSDRIDNWPAIRGRERLFNTFNENLEEVKLYKVLATLRLDVPLKQNPKELFYHPEKIQKKILEKLEISL